MVYVTINSLRRSEYAWFPRKCDRVENSESTHVANGEIVFLQINGSLAARRSCAPASQYIIQDPWPRISLHWVRALSRLKHNTLRLRIPFSFLQNAPSTSCGGSGGESSGKSCECTAWNQNYYSRDCLARPLHWRRTLWRAAPNKGSASSLSVCVCVFAQSL